MHRRGILNSNSRWQQNHWQSSQTAPPFDGGVCLRTKDISYQAGMDNQYQIIDVGNGYKWAVSRTFREMQAISTYSTLNRYYIGTQINRNPYAGYLSNLNSFVRQNVTKPNLYTIGLITYSATLLDDNLQSDPKIAKFTKTNTANDYEEFSRGITSDFAIFATPQNTNGNTEITGIYNPDAEFHTSNALTSTSGVKDLLKYFGVLKLDLQKQQVLFNTTLIDVTPDFWSNTYANITALYLSNIGTYGAYVIPLFMPCWGCNVDVDGYYVGTYYNINKWNYIPQPQSGYASEGMVGNNVGWFSTYYSNVLTYNETQISFLNNYASTAQSTMWLYWLDQMYKPIVVRMPYINNNTEYQKRYIIYQFVLFNKNTGEPLGTVV